MYLKFARRVDVKSFYHSYTHTITDEMNMLIRMILVIISQNMHILKHNIVH
jgi:hypothetical protein